MYKIKQVSDKERCFYLIREEAATKKKRSSLEDVLDDAICESIKARSYSFGPSDDLKLRIGFVSKKTSNSDNICSETLEKIATIREIAYSQITQLVANLEASVQLV
jgi:hypothetical protein